MCHCERSAAISLAEEMLSRRQDCRFASPHVMTVGTQAGTRQRKTVIDTAGIHMTTVETATLDQAATIGLPANIMTLETERP